MSINSKSDLELTINALQGEPNTIHNLVAIDSIRLRIALKEQIYNAIVELAEHEIRLGENCDEDEFCDAEDIYDDGRHQGRFEAYVGMRKLIDNVFKEVLHYPKDFDITNTY